jgi:hypothetical protein
LKKKFPYNENIKAKIRQQLQYLRDDGLIEFIGDGKYRKITKQKISSQSPEVEQIEYDEQGRRTLRLNESDQLVQCGNDSIWINKKITVNCKDVKVIHPNPEYQELIDSIENGTAYKISENAPTLKIRGPLKKDISLTEPGQPDKKEVEKGGSILQSIRREFNVDEPVTQEQKKFEEISKEEKTTGKIDLNLEKEIDIKKIVEVKRSDISEILNDIIDYLPENDSLPVNIKQFIKINFESSKWGEIAEIFTDYLIFFPEKLAIRKYKNLIYLEKEELLKLNDIYLIIKDLYEAGLTNEEIASCFNIFIEHVIGIKKHLDLKREIICVDCGKKIFARHANQMRCYECRQLQKQAYYEIKHLRFNFLKVLKTNPELAERLVQEIIDEEGPDFVKLALGDLIDYNQQTGKIIIKVTDLREAQDLLYK